MHDDTRLAAQAGVAPLPKHQITRVRREPQRRRLTVSAVESLSPRMTRVRFTSPDLADFESAAHDDHVKVFFPGAAQGGEPSGRDFTPRRFDGDQRTLTIDFALHETGPAATWARDVRVGDVLEIGGPRGSMVVADDFDWYVFVGDETALPAIGRRLEELRPGARVTTIVAVHDVSDEQQVTTAAEWRAHWIHRGADSAGDAEAIRRVWEGLEFGAGDGFVWIAAETSVARALRRYALDVRRHPPAWIKASAYWTRGRAGVHEKLEEAGADGTRNQDGSHSAA